MEAKEKPKDLDDPREYRPVDGGLYKLTVMVSAMAGITAALAWWLLRPHFTAQLSTAQSVANVGIFLAWALVAVKFLHDPFADFVREYWAKNVRGYVVAYTTYNYGSARTGFSDPFPRGSAHAEEVTKRFNFVVLWPLGGWFARPKAFWRGRRSKWTITPINGRHPTAAVRVTDGLGSSLRFATLKDATDILAVQLELARSKSHMFDTATDMPFSWLQILTGLDEQRDETQRRLDLLNMGRDEIHRDRDDAHQEREKAVKFVEDLAKATEQSSRLQSTVEGLQLLYRMVNWLCGAVVLGSPTHASFQGWRAQVLRALTEKQRRDRRQHGKPATPADAKAPAGKPAAT